MPMNEGYGPSYVLKTVKQGDLGSEDESKLVRGKQEAWGKAKIRQGSFNGGGKSNSNVMKNLDLSNADDFTPYVNAKK